MLTEIVELSLDRIGLGELTESALLRLFATTQAHALAAPGKSLLDIVDKNGRLLYPGYSAIRLEIPQSSPLFEFKPWSQAELGVHGIDIAKALIDRGFHPPTMYFPLIVKEALMIEPTETESKETIDQFIAVMIDIAETAQTNPETILACPLTTPVGRLDETKAARQCDIASI